MSFKLPYCRSDRVVRNFFDHRPALISANEYAYVEKEEAVSICEQLGLQSVPFVEQRGVPDTIDEILQIAEGKSVLNSAVEREGLVWVSGSGRDRISFKKISNRFLARGGE